MTLVGTAIPWSSEHSFLRFSDSTELEQQSDSSSDREAVGTRRVLVVDDESRIANSVAAVLASDGFSATAAYSGSSAVEIARENCPDVLLCDVLMPAMNGIETAIAIRKICPKTRVVLFSGHAAVTDMLETARAEGHHFEFLQKPIRPDDLIKKLTA